MADTNEKRALDGADAATVEGEGRGRVEGLFLSEGAERFTVEQIQNPFYWLNYIQNHPDRVRKISGSFKGSVETEGAFYFFGGEFSTQINGHEVQGYIRSGNFEVPTIVLDLSIDGRHAITSYTYQQKEFDRKVYGKKMHIRPSQINRLLNLSEDGELLFDETERKVLDIINQIIAVFNEHIGELDKIEEAPVLIRALRKSFMALLSGTRFAQPDVAREMLTYIANLSDGLEEVHFSFIQDLDEKGKVELLNKLRQLQEIVKRLQTINDDREIIKLLSQPVCERIEKFIHKAKASL